MSLCRELDYREDSMLVLRKLGSDAVRLWKIALDLKLPFVGMVAFSLRPSFRNARKMLTISLVTSRWGLAEIWADVFPSDDAVFAQPMWRMMDLQKPECANMFRLYGPQLSTAFQALVNQALQHELWDLLDWCVHRRWRFSSVSNVIQILGNKCESKKLCLLDSMHRLGMSLEEPDARGTTPLVHAVLAQDLRVAKWLLTNGVSPNGRLTSSLNPLVCAHASGNRDMISLLEQFGADTSSRLSNGQTVRECVSAFTFPTDTLTMAMHNLRLSDEC